MGEAAAPWWRIHRLGAALPPLGARRWAKGRGLLGGGVSVWVTAPVDAHEAAVLPWLSGAERERLSTMQHPRARREFLSGRWLIRGIVGGLTGTAPEEVLLVEGPRGALSVAGEGPAFNLSHTTGCVALALAPRGEIGVDVEFTGRSGRTVELAERYFAPAEVEALLALPPERQRERFFAFWTLKEAYIKARGLGLAIPLGSFAFDLAGRAIGLTTTPACGDPGQGWRFRQLALDAETQLALAWRPA